MARPASDIGPRIIAAARTRFLVEGVDGASLRAIASDAGTSIGMVYYYFPTKDDLFLAVVEETYSALLADLTRALAPDVPVEERVRRLYRRFAVMSDVETITLRLMLREALVSNDRLGRLLQRFQRGHIPLALGMLHDGVRDGTIAADLPPLVAVVITFAVGAAPQFLARRVGTHLPAGVIPPASELADLLVRILLRGIGTGTGTAIGTGTGTAIGTGTGTAIGTGTGTPSPAAPSQRRVKPGRRTATRGKPARRRTRT